jgi:hypothetical protein
MGTNVVVVDPPVLRRETCLQEVGEGGGLTSARAAYRRRRFANIMQFFMEPWRRLANGAG